MAMVRTVVARPLQQRPGLQPVARGAPQEVENLGQCRPVGGRAASGAGMRGTGPPIGNSTMGAGDRRAAETGLHTPPTRPAPKDNRQSVRSLFLSPATRCPPRQPGRSDIMPPVPLRIGNATEELQALAADMLVLPRIARAADLRAPSLGHRRAVGPLPPLVALAMSRLGFHGSIPIPLTVRHFGTRSEL